MHCRVGTPGADFHSGLTDALEAVEATFRKGEHEAAYSGFEGRDTEGNGLREWLRERDIDAVTVVGIATDYCVRATALDSAQAGFATTVLLDLTAGVAPDSVASARAEMTAAGITLT